MNTVDNLINNNNNRNINRTRNKTKPPTSQVLYFQRRWLGPVGDFLGGFSIHGHCYYDKSAAWAGKPKSQRERGSGERMTTHHSTLDSTP